MPQACLQLVFRSTVLAKLLYASPVWWGFANDDDDDDEGRINFSMALSPKTTRTRNNKLKQ